jgi:deferrochelatase/peroxidase EfeB
VYTGSQRDDGRSWIDFHDGLSNLAPEEREEAIFLRRPQRSAGEWPDGGTYMVFLRLAIDLGRWREVAREWRGQVAADRFARRHPSAQEQLVGRTLIGGCPILEDPEHPILPPGDELPTSFGMVDPARPGGTARYAFPDPPKEIVLTGEDKLLRRSHINRVTHRLAPEEDQPEVKIFRQGYQFLEPTTDYPRESTTEYTRFRAGLNFVSFQRDHRIVPDILTTKGWLGTAQGRGTRQLGGGFGGPYLMTNETNAETPPLIAAQAAGMFLVPPQAEGERFPGERLFAGRGQRGRSGATRAALSPRQSL